MYGPAYVIAEASLAAISKTRPGAEVPIPTLPLAAMYIPEPAVELDWNFASSPVIDVPVFATLSRPLVEFMLPLVVVRLNKLPDVRPFAVIVMGFSELAEDQFQICALFKESIVLAAIAAVIELNEAPPPVATVCQAKPL